MSNDEDDASVPYRISERRLLCFLTPTLVASESSPRLDVTNEPETVLILGCRS